MTSRFEIAVATTLFLSAGADAADMSFERALKVDQEPQNWLLHHGNYQGHRFSLLKEINTETVKDMKPVFTVALSGFQSGGRYAHGNLEATPLVEDGMMYRAGRLGLGLWDRRFGRQERHHQMEDGPRH
jgi:alcohol dehydrogenase (cytochrome c)